MIQVIVKIVAKPGQRAAVLQAFMDNVSAVHAEKGCIEYAAYLDAEGFGSLAVDHGQDTIIVLEKWDSAADLKAHSKAPHVVAYQAKVKDLIESRTLSLLSPA
jgi:quinol monooxygenase YgiN